MSTVLIVDDSGFMRRIIRIILEKNGFTVVGEAVDGQSGVEIFKNLKPDLVTMDVTMNEMSGIEALREIMSIDPEAKVVMISSMGQEVIVREAVILGAKGFILKPFEEHQIVDVLKKIMR